MDSVTYISLDSPQAGAIPEGTDVATHLRDDGRDIQDVYLAVGKIDSNNSSSTPLLANGVFTGVATDVTDYVELIVSVYSDKGSLSSSGIDVQGSIDGIVWLSVDTYEYKDLLQLKQWKVQLPIKYYRVVYTNGAVGQTTFTLTSKLQRVGGVSRSHAINSTVDGYDDADLVKAVLAAERTGTSGTFVNVMADVSGNLLTSIGGITQDAGGRVRVSQLTTLGDYKVLNADRPLLLENAGTGTGSYSASKFNMEVSAGQWYVRQSRRFHSYYSGKSQMFECTFDGFGLQDGVVKRVGGFSSSPVSPFSATLDGFWLENTGTTYVLKAQRAGVDTVNIDWTDFDNYELVKNHNWDNFTVILFDYLWLGGAVLRLWLKNGGGFTLLHSVHYAGTTPDVFILSPNQPVRYEIRSTTGTGSFRDICSQVSTEGSIDESGMSRAVRSGAISTTSIGTTYPVKAIRKQSAQRDIAIFVADLYMFLTSSNDQAQWSLQINPTLSAPLTYTNVANSAVQEADGNGTITVTTDGTVIAAGAISTNTVLPVGNLKLNFLASLGGTLANVMDEYVLCITPITSGVTSYSGIAYKGL